MFTGSGNDGLIEVFSFVLSNWTNESSAHASWVPVRLFTSLLRVKLKIFVQRYKMAVFGTTGRKHYPVLIKVINCSVLLIVALRVEEADWENRVWGWAWGTLHWPRDFEMIRVLFGVKKCGEIIRIVVESGHGDPGSNPWQGCWCFT